MLFLSTKSDKEDGKLNSLFLKVWGLQLLELLNSIVFLFMEPNITNSVEAMFFLTPKNNKTKKLPWVMLFRKKWNNNEIFKPVFVWKRIILQTDCEPKTSFSEPEITQEPTELHDLPGY